MGKVKLKMGNLVTLVIVLERLIVRIVRVLVELNVIVVMVMVHGIVKIVKVRASQNLNLMNFR